MEEFIAGDIVVVRFPFSDLTSSKKRPALVLGISNNNDCILCQITSKPYSSQIAIEINQSNYTNGTLPVISYIRPDKIFTANKSVISNKAASLTPNTLQKVKKILTLVLEL